MAVSTSIPNSPPASAAVFNDLFDFLAERLQLSENKAWRDALIKVVACGEELAPDYCGASGIYRQGGQLHFHMGMHAPYSTREFCESHGLDAHAVFSWLAKNFSNRPPDKRYRIECDCEVLRLVASYLFDMTQPEAARVVRQGENL